MQMRDVKTMTWEQFQGVFNEIYFIYAIQSSKVEEFASLVHGKMTMTEYTQIFDKLA